MAGMKMRGKKVIRTQKPISKTVKRMRGAAPKNGAPMADGHIGMTRDAVLAGMKRLKWSTYQLWKASKVPRTIVYTFIGKDDGRDINLRHAEAMMLAVGVSLKWI